jgi:O-antigen ligase
MHLLVLITIFVSLAFLEIFIGGARLLYAIPGILLVGLAAILSILRLKNSGGRTDLPALLSAGAFALYILVRNRFSEVEYIARLQFFIMAGCLMAYLLVALVITDPRERKLLFYFLIFLALAQLVPALIQFSEGNEWMPLSWAQRRVGAQGWRASGFFISPNNFAGYMEIISIMATSFVIWGRGGWVIRMLTAYTAVAAVAGVAISGSRGGYLSLTMGLCILSLLSFLAWTRMHERNTKVALAVSASFVFMVFLIIWWSLQSGLVIERVAQINDPQNMRLFLWAAALKQFGISPLCGTGGFSYLYYGRLFRDPLVQNDPIHVHNDYLQLLADYGITGVALFLIFLVLNLRAGIRSFRLLAGRFSKAGWVPGDRLPLVIGSLSAVAAYMVHSVVDFNMQLPLNALMMAVVFGVLANPGGKPSSSKQDSNALVSSIFKWLLPVIGLSVIAYGAPMIQGEYLAEKSRVALRDGHTKKSLEIAREGLGKYNDNPELCFDAGEAALRLSDQEKKNTQALCNESVKYFTAGLKIFPYDSRLALKLAQAQAASGNYFHALAAVSYAEKLDPNSSFVPAYRGVVEYSFGYSENAMVSFNHAIELGGEGAQIARSGMEMAQKALEMEAPARELPDDQPLPTDYPKRTEPECQSPIQSPHDHEKNSISSQTSNDLLNALPTIPSPKQ